MVVVDNNIMKDACETEEEKLIMKDKTIIKIKTSRVSMVSLMM
jgi:hypothetical protein